MIERHTADAPQPRLDVLNTDAHVMAEAFLGARARWHTEQIGGRTVHIVARTRELIEPRHVRVEDLSRDRHETGMGNPRSVVAVLHLAQLVGANAGERFLVCVGVTFDGDLSGHTTNGVRAATVTGLHGELRVCAHAWLL